MKRVLIGTLAAAVVIGVVAFLFRGSLMHTVANQLGDGMFLAADTDAFDPGLPVGARLPAIAVRYQGRTIHDLAEFMGGHGLVLYANRSVDW